MKTKLTITIDKDLVPDSKEYARSKGVSLSHVIETALRSLIRDDEDSFSRRWRGKFRPARRRGERYEALKRKYL